MWGSTWVLTNVNLFVCMNYDHIWDKCLGHGWLVGTVDRKAAVVVVVAFVHFIWIDRKLWSVKRCCTKVLKRFGILSSATEQSCLFGVLPFRLFSIIAIFWDIKYVNVDFSFFVCQIFHVFCFFFVFKRSAFLRFVVVVIVPQYLCKWNSPFLYFPFQRPKELAAPLDRSVVHSFMPGCCEPWNMQTKKRFNSKEAKKTQINKFYWMKF